MSFEEKGAYIELLIMQFTRGHMTEHMIGREVGHLWDGIKDKFIQDENGLWYNKRLDDEKEKRKNYVNSRTNNKLGKNQYNKTSGQERGHMTSHMDNENDNENKDVLKKGVQGEGFIFPKNDYEIELTEMDVGRAVQFLCFAKGVKDADADMVLAIWGTFKSKNFTGKKSYTDNRDIIRHFFESLKFQKIDGKPVKKSVGKTIDFDKP